MRSGMMARPLIAPIEDHSSQDCKKEPRQQAWHTIVMVADKQRQEAERQQRAVFQAAREIQSYPAHTASLRASASCQPLYSASSSRTAIPSPSASFPDRGHAQARDKSLFSMPEAGIAGGEVFVWRASQESVERGAFIGGNPLSMRAAHMAKGRERAGERPRARQTAPRGAGLGSAAARCCAQRRAHSGARAPAAPASRLGVSHESDARPGGGGLGVFLGLLIGGGRTLAPDAVRLRRLLTVGLGALLFCVFTATGARSRAGSARRWMWTKQRINGRMKHPSTKTTFVD